MMFKKPLIWLGALAVGVVFLIPALNHWFDDESLSLLVLVTREGLPALVSLCFEGLMVALLINYLREKS